MPLNFLPAISCVAETLHNIMYPLVIGWSFTAFYIVLTAFYVVLTAFYIVHPCSCFLQCNSTFDWMKLSGGHLYACEGTWGW